jgi:hypothetical protein
MTPLTNSSLLAKALDSGVTTSGAFIDNEDYLDYVDRLEREWKANQTKTNYRAKEWITMYPEIKQDFEMLLLEKEIEKETIAKEAKQRLKNAISIRLGDWSMILVEKIKCELGPKLEKLEKEIKWFRLGLIEPKQEADGLTEDQIQQARDVPIEDLITTKRINKMWCCPFHEEDTPSFHIYKENSWHCFGCQAHGKNAIDFVLKKNKDMSFVDAVRYLIGK